ncbi:DNA polymerase III subunit alpha [Prevotella lacticifex]|uniref:DNA polymerase III subunit alpha n=1 Tax=Prevotella lacticifex TaxID=2854755 RepID=A0A9R1CX35_9BACT|nr:DNA polymerase III subunit alpha [Prevotella lacticifex]GJG36090.1 DNA-directed DNA polymerase [Prevotella lacticifex]GJG38860.1 DNA-directed DNA polymerase [Prevotella lacticifex]GJG42459.1 DNA-directed DNA polymerase [Prevotella lacticifex]GJG45215.1 DNA-directed DNA polymerase [Prevotella lacticifex]GJG48810.1 DNA-directed DNA polymerase [Prevotella lacticifex]
MEDFVHLHCHTHYSILDGQSKVTHLVDKAVKNGMRGMAITDHGVMFGIKEFADYCAKINKDRKKEGLEPFKPIYGCEMYVAHHSMLDKVKEHGDNGGYHLIVLAKNYKGYKNLIKLVSHAWVKGYYYKPRTDRSELEKYHEGLIVLSACIAGEVPSKVLKGDIDGAREACQWYHNLFGDDYYLELQRHEVKDPNLIANRETFPLQQKANEVLIRFAKEYGIKLVCTNDCHFEDKETAEAHDHLLCLATGKDLNDPNRMRYTKQEWFKTREEMNEVFADIPEALTNTLEVLDKVEFYSIDHGPIMPFFPIPESFGTEEDIRKKYTKEELLKEFSSDENGENTLPEEEGMKKIESLGGWDKVYRIKFEAEYLSHLAYEGAKKRYGDPLSDNVKEHINFELHVMKTMGFPGYFLIVQDFINAARNELGVMVGPGRGSAAGSVVAYCLGITKIDPLKYDLLFERFLNPDRVNLPDIDTDFDDDGRGKVLRWVMDKYGWDNCAHIITYSTMATKNSIKDVARVEGLPLDISNSLCKAIPDRLPDGMKMNLANAIKCTPALQDAEVSMDSRESNTIKYAKMLEGTIRGTGIHACGFIICRDPISDWVPVSTADDPDFPGMKCNVTQYDGHVIESTGLIKMDFLGLKTLSELKEAVKVIKETTGDEVDLDNIPIDDDLTYKLYQEGRTIGTFQFESAGMQKNLRELKPTVFEDLIAMNALYRPGPMDYIPSFIRRKNGLEPIKYDIPCMEKYLKDTYGITVYQEQVMLLSRQLASFTRGESDALRKAMGKKKKAIVDAMKPKFIKQGTANGYDPNILEKIWSDWEKFASYAFNKSHATCYSWVAYQTAYLKAHYPAEYMAALMTRRFDQKTEISKLMEECKAMGIATLGPDVNESRSSFAVNKKGEIRFGMAAISGMGGAAADAIVEEREKNGPFKDIYDFAQRIDFTRVNRKAFESLAYSGGFDSLGLQREQYFGDNGKGGNFLDTLVHYGQEFQHEKQEQMNSLFGGEDVEIKHPIPPKAEKWPVIEKLNKERNLVGIYLSAHPLDEYRIILENMCNTRCREIGRDSDKEELAKREELTFGGIVTNVTERFSQKTGKPFGFVTIEDFDSSGEIGIFGNDWSRWNGMLKKDYSVFITAKCVPRFRDAKVYNINIQNVEQLYDVKSKRLEKLTISIDTKKFEPTMVNDLEEILSDSPGSTQLYFRLRSDDGDVLLHCAKKSVNVDNKLITYLQSNDAMEYKIN